MANSTVNQGTNPPAEIEHMHELHGVLERRERERAARWEAARHVTIESGRRVRVYPGSGKMVDLSELGPEVMCVGSNQGMADCEDDERIDVVDTAGNYASVSPADLLGSEVWKRLDHKSLRFVQCRMGVAA